MILTYWLISGSSPSKVQASYTDRASKLKAILDGHVQLLQPGEDQFTMELVAPECDPPCPKHLRLPAASGDDYEASYRSEMVTKGLHRIQTLLQQDPVDKPRVLYYIKKEVAGWMEEFTEPRPTDLNDLFSDLEKLQKFLLGQSGSSIFGEEFFEREKAKDQASLDTLRKARIQVSTELGLLKKAMAPMLKASEDFAFKEQQCQAEVAQLQAQLDKKQRHQEEFRLLKARNDERIAAHNAVAREATAGLGVMEGRCDAIEARVKTAASRQERLAAKGPPAVAAVLAYTCDLK